MAPILELHPLTCLKGHDVWDFQLKRTGLDPLTRRKYVRVTMTDWCCWNKSLNHLSIVQMSRTLAVDSGLVQPITLESCMSPTRFPGHVSRAWPAAMVLWWVWIHQFSSLMTVRGHCWFGPLRKHDVLHRTTGVSTYPSHLRSRSPTLPPHFDIVSSIEELRKFSQPAAPSHMICWSVLVSIIVEARVV